MARKGYVFTPARRAALDKARAVSAKKRKGRTTRRRRYTSDPVKRGTGISGLRKNFIPHVRINKRSQTTGFNAGTILPGGKKRFVVGGYFRIENTGRKSALDKVASRAGRKIAPSGTGRGQVRNYLRNSVEFKSPAIRASLPHGEARLGTSRGGGPTIIIRRGKHKSPQLLSKRGVRRYDNRMRAVAGKRARPQRRG